MKKHFIFLIFILFALSGCRIRTYTVEKPRVDLEPEGNQGYIVGEKSKKESASRLGKTRKYTVVEIELGRSKQKREETASSESKSEQPLVSEAASEIEKEAPVFKEEETQAEETKQERKNTENQPKYTTYTVKKNDTLQKISKRFYGTTRRWMKIYKANKDILKSPDKVYPGQVLKIPQ